MLHLGFMMKDMELCLMLLNNDLTVIIPTRNKVSQKTIDCIPKGVKLLIRKDRGEGQHKIRYDLAIEAKTRYLMFLDDDISLSYKEFNKMFNLLVECNLSAICCSFNPVAINNFSRSILRYKKNPGSFIPMGLTMWHRGHYLAAMMEIPKDCPASIGDSMLGEVLRNGDYNTLKLNYISARHEINLSRKTFMKRRVICGKGMAWYYLMYKKKGYWLQVIKMCSFPLTLSQGVFIYRLGNLIGLLKGRSIYA